MVHEKHVRHLKNHRNVLYGIVVILLVLQIISFISISSQISRLEAGQGVIKEDVDEYVLDLRGNIEEVRKENQFGINALSQEITDQQTSIEKEIDFLKASQEDFSGVIEDVIRGVVSIVTDRSAGSGFIVLDGSYAVTNFHVIRDASIVRVNAFDGSSFDAQVVGVDQIADLALLKIETNLDKLELGNSNRLQIGEKVIAIGNPLGLSFTVTEGIVSAVNREGPNNLEAYVQTDVALNPGNSGGPLINKEGEVVGINNFKIGGGAESLGFALESNEVEERIELILAELEALEQEEQNA